MITKIDFHLYIFRIVCCRGMCNQLCIISEFDFPEIRKRTSIFCLSILSGLILNVFHQGLIFSALFRLIIGNMADNHNRLRLSRMS